MSGRRSPGAEVADVEVDRLAMSPHVTDIREALVTVRTFVRARHLVDGLDVDSEVTLLAEGLATGLALEVLHLRMDG